MKKDYENKSLLLNTPLRGHDAGSQVRVKVDNKGVPVDLYWRNRLKDAKTDNCCEIMKKSKKAGTKKVSGKQEE